MEGVDFEIDIFVGLACGRLARDPGFTAVQTVPGIGPILAAVFVAEIGDVHRFATAEKLTCWAGLTPKHHESDTHVRRGRITKQGSRLVRWAAVESVQILPKTSHVGQIRDRVAARRGRNIGVVAAAPPAAGVRLLCAARPPRRGVMTCTARADQSCGVAHAAARVCSALVAAGVVARSD
jgi:Transposase IS116/IS110/IS902 family